MKKFGHEAGYLVEVAFHIPHERRKDGRLDIGRILDFRSSDM
jgi:hypothetical protein